MGRPGRGCHRGPSLPEWGCLLAKGRQWLGSLRWARACGDAPVCSQDALIKLNVVVWLHVCLHAPGASVNPVLCAPFSESLRCPGRLHLLVQPMPPILIGTFAELLFSVLVIAPLTSIKPSVGFHTPFVSSATPCFLVFLKPPWVADFSPRPQSLMALLAHCSGVSVVPGVCGPASHTSRPAPSVSCSFRSEVLDVLHKSSGLGEGDLPLLRVTSWTAQDAA